MQSLIHELNNIAEQLKSFDTEVKQSDVLPILEKLKKSTETVGQSWSGSWIGYQANVYYEGLKHPPRGAHFSSEWGLGERETTGDWQEYKSDDIREEIFLKAGNPNLEPARKLMSLGRALFDEKRDHLISVLEIVKSRYTDAFIISLLEEAQQIRLFTASDYIAAIAPNGVWTRDTLALSQRLWTPPHLAVAAEILYLTGVHENCNKLGGIANKTVSHLKRLNPEKIKMDTVGKTVFIGHGRSLVWRDLKDFIQDRLKLPFDEFNRVPIAGITNTNRLSQMLDDAMIALIVMTAEDEQATGKIHARMNVIHEAGLFQGRLGFNKAILLVEDGCEEFSNVNGLGQIRFPKGNIKEAFEEIRRVFEREGIIKS